MTELSGAGQDGPPEDGDIHVGEAWWPVYLYCPPHPEPDHHNLCGAGVPQKSPTLPGRAQEGQPLQIPAVWTEYGLVV